MSNLILWSTLTLDGFFGGVAPFELKWLHEMWGEELERFSLERLRSPGSAKKVYPTVNVLRFMTLVERLL